MANFLIWLFPILLLCYLYARWQVKREEKREAAQKAEPLWPYAPRPETITVSFPNPSVCSRKTIERYLQREGNPHILSEYLKLAESMPNTPSEIMEMIRTRVREKEAVMERINEHSKNRTRQPDDENGCD